MWMKYVGVVGGVVGVVGGVVGEFGWVRYVGAA